VLTTWLILAINNWTTVWGENVACFINQNNLIVPFQNIIMGKCLIDNFFRLWNKTSQPTVYKFTYYYIINEKGKERLTKTCSNFWWHFEGMWWIGFASGHSNFQGRTRCLTQREFSKGFRSHREHKSWTRASVPWCCLLRWHLSSCCKGFCCYCK